MSTSNSVPPPLPTSPVKPTRKSRFKSLFDRRKTTNRNITIDRKIMLVVLSSVLVCSIVCGLIYLMSFPIAAILSSSPTILACIVYVLLLIALIILAIVLKPKFKLSRNFILAAMIPYVVFSVSAMIWLGVEFRNNSYKCGIVANYGYTFYNSLGRKIAYGDGVYVMDGEPVVVSWDRHPDDYNSEIHTYEKLRFYVRIYNQDGVQIYADDDWTHYGKDWYEMNEDENQFMENIKSRLGLKPVY